MNCEKCNKFGSYEAISESMKKKSDYEEAQELLYMFYYSEEASFRKRF